MQFSLGALEALRNRRNDKAAKHKSIIEEKGSINLTARRSGVELQCVVRLSVCVRKEVHGCMQNWGLSVMVYLALNDIGIHRA